MREEDVHKRSLDAIRQVLADMTEDEKEELRESMRDKRPKGWLSIEDHLPTMRAGDIMQGYTAIRVRDKDGEEFVSGVSDHNTWYYAAKEDGITEWFNE